MDVTCSHQVRVVVAYVLVFVLTCTVVELTSESGEDVVAMLLMISCHLSQDPLPLAHVASQRAPRLKFQIALERKLAKYFTFMIRTICCHRHSQYNCFYFYLLVMQVVTVSKGHNCQVERG